MKCSDAVNYRCCLEIDKKSSPHLDIDLFPTPFAITPLLYAWDWGGTIIEKSNYYKAYNIQNNKLIESKTKYK